MTPLAWLAIPVLATAVAALVVPAVLHRRNRPLAPAERAARLRRALAPDDTPGPSRRSAAPDGPAR